MSQEGMEARLARIETKVDMTLDKLTGFCQDCKTSRKDFDNRIDSLEKDAIRTKTFFGIAGTALMFLAGIIGAWVRSKF